MRRAALAFVVTVLVVVAGVWLREQGPPLEGGDRLWDSRAELLADVDTVVASGERHTALRAGEAPPVLVDRTDGSVVRLPGDEVLGISADGSTITASGATLYGADAAGRTTWEKSGRQLVGADPVSVGSDGTAVALAGCDGEEGRTIGLDIASGEQLWEVEGACAAVQPDAGGTARFYVSTRPARAFADGPAIDAFVYEVADGRRVADFRRVRDVHLVGDDLLVLDADHQLSAHQGSESRWLLDPETAALAGGPAQRLETGYAGTPMVVFSESERALVDTASGTLRRLKQWGQGPLTRESTAGVVAHGREYLWDDRELVVRNVFTGRELWRSELPAGEASAAVADAALVVVSVTHTDGRRQVFAHDALTGERLSSSRRTDETWLLLPTGDSTVLATSGERHRLLAVR